MQNHENDHIDDLDKDWKPTGRPQSTMARNFSAALDDLFQINDGIDSISQKIFEKKQAVSTQNQELNELEARLRETEERLKKAGQAPFTRHDSQRQAEQDKSGNPHGSVTKSDTEEGSADEASRHQTSPETSITSSPEYVMVDRPLGP